MCTPFKPIEILNTEKLPSSLASRASEEFVSEEMHNRVKDVKQQQPNGGSKYIMRAPIIQIDRVVGLLKPLLNILHGARVEVNL